MKVRAVGEIDLFWLTVFGAIIILLALLLTPILYPESASYLVNYLDYRSLGEKIFDINSNEIWNAYQSRELSYFFDWINSYAVKFFIKNRYVMNYFSPLHYLFLFIISSIAFSLFSRSFTGKKVTLSLFIIIFLFSPSVRAAYYFRTAKIVTSFLVFLVIVISISFLRRSSLHTVFSTAGNRRSDFDTYIKIFLISFLATISDRMGFFLMIAIAAIIVFLTIFEENKKPYLMLSLAICTSVLVSTLYNYRIGPDLIYYFNNYLPDFRYQQMPLEMLTFEHFSMGFYIVIEQVSCFLGNAPSILGVTYFLVTFLVLIAGWRRKKYLLRVVEYKMLVILVMSVIALTVMYALMILKHPPIAMVEIRTGYYSLIIHVLFFIFNCYFLIYLFGNFKLPKFLIPLLCLIFVLSDLYFIVTEQGHHLSEKQDQQGNMKSGIVLNQHPLFSPITQSLNRCIVNKNTDAIQYSNLPKRYFEVCSYFRLLGE